MSDKLNLGLPIVYKSKKLVGPIFAKLFSYVGLRCNFARGWCLWQNRYGYVDDFNWRRGYRTDALQRGSGARYDYSGGMEKKEEVFVTATFFRLYYSLVLSRKPEL